MRKNGPKKETRLVKILYETDQTVLRVYPPTDGKPNGIIEHLEKTEAGGWLATQTILSKKEWTTLQDFFYLQELRLKDHD